MQIAVIGAGYVGLVTGACFARLGHRVSCVDSNPGRVSVIRSGRAPFYEPGLDVIIRDGIESGALLATTETMQAVSESDITFIAVGTPSSGGACDLRQLGGAAEQVGAAVRGADRYHTVVVKSTVVPGTTDTLVRSILERTSAKSAGELGLCMNPEFLREGCAVRDFMHPDRIVIGQLDDGSGAALAQLYAAFDCPKLTTTLRSAELIKYASNAVLATLISFSNQIAEICEAVPGTDIDTVLRGVHLDRRWSCDGERQPEILSYLRAGCGFGGSCLPKDVQALRAFAREHGTIPELLEAVDSINCRRPARLVRLAEQALGPLAGRVITLLGLAFKPDSDDLRHSPALAIADLLLREAAVVRAYDPVVTTLDGNRGITTYDCAADALVGADAAIIVTAWPEFRELDWSSVSTSMRCPVIVDGRNLLSEASLPPQVRYYRIGRAYHERDSK